MKDKRLIGLVAIGLILAFVVPTVTALVVSSAVTVTIYPSANINLTTDKQTYTNGESINLTATLAAGMSDAVVSFKDGSTVLGTATSVGGVATFQTTAVNSGLTSIIKTFTAEIA